MSQNTGTQRICQRCQRENPQGEYAYPDGTVYCPRCGAMLPTGERSRAPMIAAFLLLALLLVGVGFLVTSLLRNSARMVYETEEAASSWPASQTRKPGGDADDGAALAALLDDPTAENLVAFFQSDLDDVEDDDLYDAYFAFLGMPATREQTIAVAQALQGELGGYLSEHLLLRRYAQMQDDKLLYACDDIAPVYDALLSPKLLELASVMLDTPVRDLSWTDMARVEMMRFGNATGRTDGQRCDSFSYRLRGDIVDRTYPGPLDLDDGYGMSAFFNLKELDCDADIDLDDELYIMSALERVAFRTHSVEEYEYLADLENLASIRLYGSIDAEQLGYIAMIPSLTDVAFRASEGCLLDPLLGMPHLAGLSIEYAENADCEMIAKMPQLRRLALTNAPDDLSFLAPLTNLESLHISRSATKTLAPLANMARLTDLTLDMLTEVDDLSALAACTDLRRLDIDCSGVEDYAFVSHLRKLESASFGRLRTFQPLEGLPELHTLRANGADGFATLQTLPKLASLTLRGASAYDRGLDFSGLDLTSLSLYDCRFYRSEDSVFALKNLAHLEIRGGVFCSDFSKIAALGKLEELYIADAQIIRGAEVYGGGGIYSIDTDDRKLDAYASALGKLASLRWMRIAGMDVKDVSFVEGMEALVEAYVPDNRIEDATPFARLPKLAILDVSRNALSGTAGLEGIPVVITDGAEEPNAFFLQ